MRMNEGQLPEQLFWRWVNLCEQKGISLSERPRVWRRIRIRVLPQRSRARRDEPPTPSG